MHIDMMLTFVQALRRLCWFLGVDADYCIVQPVPPLSASEAPAFTTCLSPAEAEYLISLVSWNAGRPNYIATPGSGGTQLRSVLSRLHSFSRVVMKCTGTSLEEHVNRLEVRNRRLFIVVVFKSQFECLLYFRTFTPTLCSAKTLLDAETLHILRINLLSRAFNTIFPYCLEL